VAEVPHISAVELAQRLENGDAIDVIDVREDWERAIVALPFARQIRMIEILTRVDEIPRDRPVVIMCRTGSRSSRTVEMLQSHGFDNVLNLDGGILAWAREIDPTLPQFYT